MTHSSPIPVAQELANHFKSAVESETVRWFQACIRDEQIVEVATGNKGGSVESDFTSMVNHAKDDEASYFLFRLSGLKNWLLLTYVPDAVSVKAKMVMASAKGTLKDQLGHAYFVEETHATTKGELSYESYQGTKKSIDSRSAEEVDRDNVHKLEEEARNDMAARATTSTTSGGIGGYHSVNIPLSAQAKDEIQQFKAGSVNFVELIIDETKECVNAGKGKNVSIVAVGKEVHTGEPRFYLYSFQRGIQKVNAFVYSCPDKSPAKLRMVYSTAKPAIADQIGKLGVQLAPKRVEITEGSELEEGLRGDLHSSPSTVIKAKGPIPEGGGVVKARTVPTIGNTQHAIYGLMGRANPDSPKKKIVMPPPGAYNG